MFHLKQLFLLFPLFLYISAQVAEVRVKQRQYQTPWNELLPPAKDVVCMARFIVHNSEWCSIAYLSVNNKTTQGTPLARVFSLSDGPLNNGSGNVYFMVSPLDLTVQDLLKNDNCSIVMSLAQTNLCSRRSYDAQDPRCAQVVLHGQFVPLLNTTEEYNFAKMSLWKRHPIMKFWYYEVPEHEWIFTKLVINQIAVVDFFGGRKFPSVDEYYKKNCSQYVNRTAPGLSLMYW